MYCFEIGCTVQYAVWNCPQTNSTNMLELPATYGSYPEFVKEFQQVLSDETYSWIMDAL